MRLKTPSFWYAPPRPEAFILMPFSLLYQASHRLRQYAISPFRAAMPVLCVGNLVTGGSGKTPASIALMALVKAEHLATAPGFLTRGYGGKEYGPALVDPTAQTACETGDEPLLLARHAPVIVSKNRKNGALFARKYGLDLLIMDDGLQNPTLHKDIRLIVIDGDSGFGNGLTLPAGPLREPLRTGLAKADAFILIGEDRRNVKALLPKNIPLFEASLEIAAQDILKRQTPYVAFCGLGRPEKFRKTLERANINIVSWHAFPDHYVFTARDLASLADEAKKCGARLITTEKDAVRIPADIGQELPLDILPVRLVWQNEEALRIFLKQKLAARS